METVLELVNKPVVAQVADDLAAAQSRIQARFEEFDRAHPEVFRGLVEVAREARSRGHKTYSMAAVWEVFRWNSRLPLNNDFRSRYARKIMAEIPELKGFFETRLLVEEK